MNLQAMQTQCRCLLWVTVLTVPLLSSCVSRQQSNGSASASSREPVKIQSETKWPTDGAWWAKEDPVALQTKTKTIRSSSQWKRLKSPLLLASKVVDATKTDRSSMKISFRLDERPSQVLVLIGPEKLSQYVFRGQQVVLCIDEKGNIASIDPFVNLDQWQREGSLIRTKFVSSKVSTHSISLLITERQLFEGYEVRNEKEFRHVYFSPDGLNEQGKSIWYRGEFEGKPYESLSQSQKGKLLGSGTNYEILITPRGLECWSASGYGGGEENAPEWIMSSPASEDFE